MSMLVVMMQLIWDIYMWRNAKPLTHFCKHYCLGEENPFFGIVRIKIVGRMKICTTYIQPFKIPKAIKSIYIQGISW